MVEGRIPVCFASSACVIFRRSRSERRFMYIMVTSDLFCLRRNKIRYLLRKKNKPNLIIRNDQFLEFSTREVIPALDRLNLKILVQFTGEIIIIIR